MVRAATQPDDAMTTQEHQTTRLADYTPPPWLVDHVKLTFRLGPNATRVTSRIAFRPNPDAATHPFRLDGAKVKLIRASVDGQKVTPVVDAEGMTLAVPAQPFTWDAEVEIDPAANTALSGLYMSNGMYCTQCEAEGFRHITYYPDRPDVMAPFDVRIEADLPVLLSNGNPGSHGKGWAEWSDPWPKPAYLFALVAGDLVAHRDSLTTMSGRNVDLAVWVRPGDEDRCAYAMDALKRSMQWDEAEYGRAYDLDVFNIVAVDDFNMGAMENKGLNIFNSKFVLASPETATDTDYDNIERIVAHEYFHNWTGNRITCRDWFQLSLKEGLTVFRDQQFSAHERGAALRRIGDVEALRARQFREDAGPLAHPVRPAAYQAIDNFYTATIYEKGAEVIRMLRRLVGEDGYRAALDLYFDRHDGQACTIEDWLGVFADTTGRDLGQFKRWYEQAGTPRVAVSETWEDGTYRLTFRQSVPDTPGQTGKAPMTIPMAVALLGPNGNEVLTEQVLELTEAEQSFEFKGMGAKPVPSLNRGFTAPVILEGTDGFADPAFLMAHETDPFNRFEATRSFARRVLKAMVLEGAGVNASYLDGLGRIAGDAALDPAFRAMCLGLPSEAEVAQMLHDAGSVPDPDAIHAARRRLAGAIAQSLEAPLGALWDGMADNGPYSPDAGAAGRRALRHAALRYLSLGDGGARAKALFATSRSMTETIAALSALIPAGLADAELGAFHARWRGDANVLDKWFGLQAGLCPPDRAVEVANALAAHADFAWKTPNRFRALLGGFASNFAGFHDASGDGYRLYADWLTRLDPLNPLTAARMTSAFESWTWFDERRRDTMRGELDRMLAVDGLSKDTTEMLTRIRGRDG